MTDEEKIGRMIEYLTEGHLWVHGGYPYDYEYEEGDEYVWVAELDDGKDRMRTALVSYQTRDLIDHYDRAAQYIEDTSSDEEPLSSEWVHYTGGNFGDWDEALGETYKK